jgi:hypothetical protein
MVGPRSLRQLLDNQDRRHPPAPLQETDVIAVQVGLLGEPLLGEARVSLALAGPRVENS